MHKIGHCVWPWWVDVGQHQPADRRQRSASFGTGTSGHQWHRLGGMLGNVTGRAADG
jgi:hypothetical protein